MAGVAYGQLNYCAQRAAIRLGLFAADNDRCDQLACDSIPKFGQDERKIVDKTKEKIKRTVTNHGLELIDNFARSKDT